MSHVTRAARGLAVALIALCLSVLLAGRSGATSIRLSLPELSAASQFVVRGRVERIESAWTPDRRIESTVYVRLSAVPRGHLSTGALIPVRVRGGRVGEVTMQSSEEPTFVAGEEAYLFLAELTAQGYRVAAGRQGKFDIVGDRALNRAWQLAYRLADLDAGVLHERWPAEAQPLSAADALSPAAAQPAPGGYAPEGYVLNGQHWPGAHPMEESYVVNINTADAGGGNGSVDAFRNAILAAGNAWGGASANFAFHYGGASGVTTSGSDGQNVIHWENMGNSATLAESTWWYYGSEIVEADIRFNDYYVWDATGSPSGNEPDVQSVATHELGHWLSLDHDSDASCPNSSAIMCATYNMGTLKRSLGANDIAGIKAIYGAAAAPPTNTPRPTATRTNTPRPTYTATPTRTPVPTLPPWRIKSRVRLPMILHH